MKGYCFFQAVLNLDLYFAAPLSFLVDLLLCLNVEGPGLSGELNSSSEPDTESLASAMKISFGDFYFLYIQYFASVAQLTECINLRAFMHDYTEF